MPNELEKKNLEMHVELEALRDKTANDFLLVIEAKIKTLIEEIKELRELVDDMKDERTNQLIKWGTAIIGALFTALGLLILKILVPALLSK